MIEFLKKAVIGAAVGVVLIAAALLQAIGWVGFQAGIFGEWLEDRAFAEITPFDFDESGDD